MDNHTVLDSAQGISEIMNQVLGQAGPTKMAKNALGTTNGKPNGATPETTPS